MDEEDDLALQQVEAFARLPSDQWSSLRPGTVMWLQDDDSTGPIHRLLVMERGASTDAPALELASVALPSPSVAFSFAEDDGLLSFGVEGGAEVALAFVADEGAVQVYQDVQAVQGLAGGAPPPGLGLGLGLDAGPHPLELPPPSEATLPEVARLLAGWPPHARAAAPRARRRARRRRGGRRLHRRARRARAAARPAGARA